MRPSPRILVSLLFGLCAAFGPAAPGRAENGPPQPSFVLPLDCRPGRTCWISQYVDLDQGPGLRDYNCGKSTYRGYSTVYDGHEATNFALQDMEAMRRGITVKAAAAGVVVAMRDGMPDADYRASGGRKVVKGRECGNRVGISHGRGWLTDYCHLRKGSVRVKKGDRVEQGQEIGQVGISGMSDHPHLHFAVLYGSDVIDPFVGRGRRAECGIGPRPLWADEVLAQLPYQASALFNVGFAPERPRFELMRDGAYRDVEVAPDSPVFVLWAETFHPYAGDILELRIRGPDGWMFYENRKVIEKTEDRRWDFAGKKSKGQGWPVGPYTATYRLIREDGPRGREEYTRNHQIRIRPEK